MRIAISAQNNNEDSLLDPRFGRCAYFHIYDTEKQTVEVIKNVAVSADGGAGIKAANNMIEKNIDILVTGHLGPNASAVINESNIEVVSSETKKITEILEGYKANK